ncbi:MAG: bifunctional heptose 7-phosphate kinase/heptose 1-phosphate adenyltransferase [Verrucomicrobiales bacterium]
MSDLASTESLALVDAFSKQRLLVVGDVMLDWFIWGAVSRISPEAPVPVVEVQRENRYPGGAANVGRNITPFGSHIELAGLFGHDPNGKLLLETLSENGIGTDLLLQTEGIPTITKTRVIAGHQQVVRIDRERKVFLSSEQEQKVVDGIMRIADQLDGVIIEDYGKGLITPSLAEKIIAVANSKNLVVTVDPKPGNPIPWKGCTCVKPNRSEAFAAAGVEDLTRNDDVPPLEDKVLLQTGHQLLKTWQSDHVLVTLGELGMLLFSKDSDAPFHIPTRAQEVFDVSGAGDTAIAVFTLALCAGASAKKAAELSNVASGIVVGKLGTAPIERDELITALQK